MRLNAKQIIAATGGVFLVQPIEPSEILCGVTWDSREVEPGWLFVALVGEHVNGHDFVDAALSAGALGVLVTEQPSEATLLLAREMGASIIEVSDAYHAIRDLAAAWRAHINARVIGITGSVGKTTTKNMVRDVASCSYRVVATEANQNNELGVPRTILAADPDTEIVVVEMGMRGRGQITELCDLVHPDWGLITNVCESHLELLGSRENIARAKAELIDSLPTGTGRAFLNMADDSLSLIMDSAHVRDKAIRCVGFNGEPSCDVKEEMQAYVWAQDINLDAEGRPQFTLCAQGFDVSVPTHDSGKEEEQVPCTLSLRGLHNVANACAAAAIGRSLGIDSARIAEALACSLPERGRLEVIRARGGFSIVNDSYNANPESMRASLSTFCAQQTSGRRFAVLGDMEELGQFAEACHRSIGQMAAKLPLDFLICVGGLAQFIGIEAQSAGMSDEKISCVDSVADVLEILDGRLEEGDSVLVKGSHAVGLEHVVEGLVS